MHNSLRIRAALLSGFWLGLPPATAATAQVGSPAGAVPPQLLEARRQALLERLGSGVAIVRSAEPRSIEGDYPQDSDYRESNDFFFLTGLEAPDAALVLVARESGADSVVLYLPARNPAAERWTGPRRSVSAIGRTSASSFLRRCNNGSVPF